MNDKFFLPKISVITVVFNSVDFIEETINSVLKLAYLNIEYIIIDGGSNDGTVEIIKRYDGYINYWITERDNGIYDAMNKGISIATGDWLVFLNSGDFFSDPTVFGGINFNNDQIDIFYSDTILMKNGLFSIEKASLRKKRFVHQSFLYRRDLHKTYGNYLSLPKLTIADYLFLAPLWTSDNSIKLSKPISVFRCGGLSSGDSHMYQKMAVDLMCGFSSPIFTALKIIIFPAYKIIYSKFLGPLKNIKSKIKGPFKGVNG